MASAAENPEIRRADAAVAVAALVPIPAMAMTTRVVLFHSHFRSHFASNLEMTTRVVIFVSVKINHNFDTKHGKYESNYIESNE